MALRDHLERSIFAAVDEDRLWRRMMDMALIGRVGETGVNRPAFSDEDAAARRLLHAWGRDLGLRSYQDAIGNLFLHYGGTVPHLGPVLTGSHLDSQPTGGRFDGTFGVMAGLEAVAALQSLGVRPRRSIEIVAWSNEEGSRFAPGAMGSQIYAGTLRMADLQSVRDSSGMTVEEAARRTLAALPEAELRDGYGVPVAYLEAHIEQGPVLEQNNLSIGVVTAIQGCVWFELEVRGEAAHAGTTPQELRRDALQAAMGLIASLRLKCLSLAPDCRFTVGRFCVAPNSPNTIPGRVTFTIDLRHPDAATFSLLASMLQQAWLPLPFSLEVRQLFCHPPEVFPPEITRTIEDVAESVHQPALRMTSGAFHDALFVSRRCPVGMIFVRSRRGISHNAEEFSERTDLADGTRVLAVALYRLAA